MTKDITRHNDKTNKGIYLTFFVLLVQWNEVDDVYLQNIKVNVVFKLFVHNIRTSNFTRDKVKRKRNYNKTEMLDGNPINRREVETTIMFIRQLRRIIQVSWNVDWILHFRIKAIGTRVPSHDIPVQDKK